MTDDAVNERAAAAYAEISGDDTNPFAWASKSAATWLNYQSHLRTFHAWCFDNGDCALPASTDTLRTYMLAMIQSGRAVATVNAHLAAVATQHRLRGYSINRPALADTAKGMRRLHGAPPKQARPILADELQKLLAQLDPSRPADVRDGALLSLGWALAGRRSELVGLDWKKLGTGQGVVATARQGLAVKLVRSKSSQDKPVDIPIPTEFMPSAVDWVKRWVRLAGVADKAPLFTSVDKRGEISTRRLAPRSVERIIRKRVAQLKMAEGLGKVDAFEEAQATSGHSLRAGFITTAAVKRVPEYQIRARSRHKTPSQVAAYVRAAESWGDNALREVGF